MQTENLHTTDCIRTFSGLYMNVFDPKPEMICIEDIAHALAHQCRFAGHMKRFYSVAQHSVMCADHFDNKYRLQALMHDASEAYLLDFPKPIKENIKGYKEMEDRMMELIAKKFEFNYPLDTEVKEIDRYMLETEWKHLVIKDSGFMESWEPTRAKQEFLQVFHELTKEVTHG